MEKSAALSATMAMWEFAPRSTRLVMVCATVALIILMTNTPRKLKIAAIISADCADMHRVVTQVAMALGASVEPLTRITPRVSTAATISSGFWVICDQKYWNDKSISISAFPRDLVNQRRVYFIHI